jgi:hypothetical protein
MKAEEDEVVEDAEPPLNVPPPWVMRPFPYELILKDGVPLEKSVLGIPLID